MGEFSKKTDREVDTGEVKGRLVTDWIIAGQDDGARANLGMDTVEKLRAAL